MKPEDLRLRAQLALANDTEASRSQALGRVIRDFCHDLNNTLGTIALEHYSIGTLAAEAAAGGAGEIDELRAALANGDEARREAEALVAALHEAGRLWEGRFRE